MLGDLPGIPITGLSPADAAREAVLAVVVGGLARRYTVGQIIDMIATGDLAGKLEASDIPFDPGTGPLSATDMQGALDEMTGAFTGLLEAAAEDMATILSALRPGMTNLIINGDFAINQRGFAGGVMASEYGHDRITQAGWGVLGQAEYSVSGDVVTHPVASSGNSRLMQVIESPGLAGQQVTFSVEDLTGGDLYVNIGSEEGVITPGEGRRGVTLTVPPELTGNVAVNWRPFDTTVTYRRVALNVGSVALPFERRHPAAELALCQRYFHKEAASIALNIRAASGTPSEARRGTYALPVTMRSTPAVAFAVTNGTPSLYDASASSVTFQSSIGGPTNASEVQAGATFDAEL